MTKDLISSLTARTLIFIRNSFLTKTAIYRLRGKSAAEYDCHNKG
ncbi:hypothetical protein HMPREF0880_03351 [Yokenella regensburgei ATCC 43003]|nr:hypothetical protein HMPREF0880_03351 [Yokenella regensburgei ATCC 43003]